ncbi:eukaryotic translation initiation factor 5B-like isoform X1 [Montipora foliosa]|uniref:eukaryotic translation initiation factor 5B-like isoform X1 n=2 Tax=Montipora foliosa TaxID=591990 RepID=UPI0035F114A8
MTLRKLLRETDLPSRALFFFPEENMTGIGPTKMIIHKKEAVVGGMVSVNWEGEIVQAKLIALSDSHNELHEKDILWTEENLQTSNAFGAETNIESHRSRRLPNEPPKKRSRTVKNTKEKKANKTKDAPSKPSSASTEEVVELSDKEQEDPAAQSDPYQKFLQEQRKREEEWATNRRAGAAKKPSHESAKERSCAVKNTKEKKANKTKDAPSKPSSASTEEVMELSDKEQEDPAAQSDLYQKFLQEQRKREEEWATNRRAGAAKKPSHESAKERSCAGDPAAQLFPQEQSKGEEEWASNRRAGVAKRLMLPLKDIDSADDVSMIREQLEAKTRECDRLRNRIDDQEGLCKLMDKFEEYLLSFEENMGHRLSRIEQRLESLETAFRGKDNFDSLLHEDLLTIDMETVATLREEEEGSTVPPAQATQESTLMPATPISATNRNAVSTTETPVSEEVIRTCVTPRKVRAVQSALKKENERHRCAVKLLPYFFTDEELISSNTDGTHGKLPLDSNKLNFLKVLVFSKFPVEFAVEKEKVWKFIKTKINDRCRAVKFANREH